MPAAHQPQFSVISGKAVNDALVGRETEVIDIVRRAYLSHGEKLSVNPPSYFLTFPDRPSARIIALPASLGAGFATDGLKWISSFPQNIESGLPRASAVLILNDQLTGYPYACLEASIISATRTAASAALAADRLLANGDRPRTATIFGTGVIARHILKYLTSSGWRFDRITVYDISAEYARTFAAMTAGRVGEETDVTVAHNPEQALRASDLVVFATTSAAPHITDPSWLSHNPTVLHISLRDLSPEVIISAANIVDDVGHCLQANTSPHLAEQLTGSRDFITGSLHDVLMGEVALDRDRPTVFSPFGLGILDLAVGRYVYDWAVESGQAIAIDGFFHDLQRFC